VVGRLTPLCYAASNLGVPVADVQASKYADGETNVRAFQRVGGHDVFIVQSTSRPVNENLIRLVLMITTVKRAGARHVTAVIPYYGYLRAVGAPPAAMDSHTALLFEEAKRARKATSDDLYALPEPVSRASELETNPISARDVADLLEAAGVDSVIAIDLQPPGQGQIEVGVVVRLWGGHTWV
jgi:phosphoribosylpyrophosphate synthetase